jgi:hypothetical protein
MKASIFTAGVLASAAYAHYTFPGLIYEGQVTQDWQYVRKTTNYQSHGPLQDVTSSQLGCYQLAPGSEGAQTMSVNAGDNVGFRVDPQIQHPGPLMFYMAKAPSTVTDWDPSGAVWFKIWEDHPTFTSQNVVWATDASNNNQGVKTVNVTLPSCLASGEYLLRVEHIGLHSAQQAGGAQFYIGCAQLSVKGSGTYVPSSLVSLPGAYKASDPGIEIDIWYPVPTSYQDPGPAPMTCP